MTITYLETKSVTSSVDDATLHPNPFSAVPVIVNLWPTWTYEQCWV